ncbi:MAG: hypothetical protein GYA26_08780 [Flexilinea flocculi]|nr:hypothetical protein [Flexilinea flocculi]
MTDCHVIQKVVNPVIAGVAKQSSVTLLIIINDTPIVHCLLVNTNFS